MQFVHFRVEQNARTAMRANFVAVCREHVFDRR